MKLSHKKSRWIARALAAMAVVVLVSACGTGLGMGRGGRGGSPFGNQGGSFSSGNPSGGGTQTRNPGNLNAPNYGYSQELQVCDQYRAISNSVATACGATLQSNMDELTRECATNFDDLYDISCNGLRDRLQSVFSNCNSDISQYWSYLPQNCQTVLNRYIRR